MRRTVRDNPRKAIVSFEGYSAFLQKTITRSLPSKDFFYSDPSPKQTINELSRECAEQQTVPVRGFLCECPEDGNVYFYYGGRWRVLV